MHAVYLVFIALFVAFFAAGIWLVGRRGRRPREGEEVIFLAYFEFPSRPAADVAAEELRGQGFHVEPDVDPNDPDVGLLAQRPIHHQQNALDSRIAELESWSEQAGGQLVVIDVERGSGPEDAFGFVFFSFLLTGFAIHGIYWLVRSWPEPVEIADGAYASMPPSWFAAWLGAFAAFVLVYSRIRPDSRQGLTST